MILRTFIVGLLLATFLAQGWARADMAAAPEPATQSDCGGHMPAGDTGGCCPDGAAGMGACAAACSAAFALTAAAPDVAVVRSDFHLAFPPAFEAGPRYLPLNPPPIA